MNCEDIGEPLVSHGSICALVSPTDRVGQESRRRRAVRAGFETLSCSVCHVSVERPSQLDSSARCADCTP